MKLYEPLLLTILTILMIPRFCPGQVYPWASGSRADSCHSIGDILTPDGFKRPQVSDSSFGEWLRGLPLKPAGHPVLLYDGRRKDNQSAHERVIDIDVGRSDLQQCADAVMRLRAEYLYNCVHYDAVHFNFTSGDTCRFSDWLAGLRPLVQNDRVSWTKSAGVDSSYSGFRDYLNTVFTYAGSYSLAQELETVANPDSIAIGDVFIQGGFPGHAVIVVDLAINKDTGRKAFLLAQSYMPAQEVHILKNPVDHDLSPWYMIGPGSSVVTPEWTFRWSDLKRFGSR